MRTRAFVAGGIGVVLLGAAPSGPAAAFLDTWSKIPSYTATIKTHAVKGRDTQDRTYTYAFLKPHFARLNVTSGPGRGGGAVWRGGDTVSGHQGGLLSGIHLTVPLHDPKAVDLRGGTIVDASFDNAAENVRDAASVTNGEEALNGATYDTVTVPYKDANGATKRVIFLSRTTHLPVRRTTYAGDAVVETEDFSDVNAPAGLKEGDF